MPRKKIVQKRTRTPGFTTIDKEIHDLLDAVRPVAERVYRKLHQRINEKRGDRMVFPDWDQLLTDTGITNRRTLGRAIEELESVGLIVVDRSYNKDLQRSNVNRYYIVPPEKLSQWQNYREPVAKLQKPSGKTATVTRTKRTRTNITKMKKGVLKKDLNSSSSPRPTRLSPDVNNQHEKGQWQKDTGSHGVRPTRATPVSAEEMKRRDEERKRSHPNW